MHFIGENILGAVFYLSLIVLCVLAFLAIRDARRYRLGVFAGIVTIAALNGIVHLGQIDRVILEFNTPEEAYLYSNRGYDDLDNDWVSTLMGEESAMVVSRLQYPGIFYADGDSWKVPGSLIVKPVLSKSVYLEQKVKLTFLWIEGSSDLFLMVNGIGASDLTVRDSRGSDFMIVDFSHSLGSEDIRQVKAFGWLRWFEGSYEITVDDSSYFFKLSDNAIQVDR